MKVTDARTGIEWLDREVCLALLRHEVVGRIAVCAAGVPTIFPVNFTMDGDSIVFRTAAGTKLTAGLREPVCFEIDRMDRVRRAGWSVLVTGRLEEVTPFDGPTHERVSSLTIDPWADGEKPHVLRLVPDRISGRCGNGG